MRIDESHSIRDIQKKALRIRSATFILDIQEHPQIAKEFEALKLGSWKKYEHHRDGYTDAKTDFIRKLTAEAHKVYGDRY